MTLRDDGGLPFKRQTLRTATLILPRTGERIKRAVTLREPDSNDGARDAHDGGDVGPESPLLAMHRRKSKRRDVKFSYGAAIKLELQNWAKWTWNFCTSKTGQGILKCSIAYLLGSMATFIPFLSNFLGYQDGKHMVATITVYFHPARSQGSMFEAMFLAVVAFIYAAFISFTSMGVSMLFDEQLDLIVLGHILVLIVFCGGGLGLVGWVKQRLGNPLVNVACSLASLGIITVLTKEGSVQEGEFSPDKIVQVLKMVSMGVIATTIVCFVLFPISARKELRKNLRELTDSFGDMLAMITRGFLTGSEEELEQRGFHEASDRYKAFNASLSKHHSEAKWEHYVYGTEGEYNLETKLISCMQRMAQNIGGLRSAATTQFNLLAQSTAYGGATPLTSAYTPTTAGLSANLTRIDSWMSYQENFPQLEAIEENPSEEELDKAREQKSSEESDGPPTMQRPADIFERFIMHLGPSMKSLAFTLKQILDELPYGPAPQFKIAVNPHFRSSLVEAITLYSNARGEALALLYKNKELCLSRPMALEADFEEVAASCGYFSFSLLNFAQEMKSYLDILDEFKDEVEKPFWQRRSWTWLKFWQKYPSRAKRRQVDENDPEQNTLITRDDLDNLNTQPSPTIPENDSVLEDRASSRKAAISYRIWKTSRFFRRDDIKYAIKVGAGAALYALPAFVEDTRPLYSHWRGEWGLLSYMLVCSMTIGASNTTGFSRAFGTCLGAVCACLAWIISQGNVFLMAFFGWLMALATFYVIIGLGRGPLGRFILLTYNLSALYAYSLSARDDWDFDDDGEEDRSKPMIATIAFHRVIAVLSGCLWGLVITRMIWPISARNKFRDGLGLLLLRMGLIWKRDPLATVLEGQSVNSYMNLAEEFRFQKYLTRLEALRTSASYEFELKGPFPKFEYAQVLKSLGRMLDAFHAMNTVITKGSHASRGEAEILRYTSAERGQLCSRISHLFQVMASSFKLEFPLNEGLPNTEHARDRLLAKVFKFRKDRAISRFSSDEDYSLLYAYALVTGQLSKEIREVGQVVESLFGVLDEDLLKLQ